MKAFIKKFFVILVLGITLFGFTGCSTKFAEQDYNNDSKIVNSDHFVKNNYELKAITGGLSLTASKFNGRETFWKMNLTKKEAVEVRYNFSISSGYAKIVHIDSDNIITVIAECSQDDSINQSGSTVVFFTSGQNRIKLVAYDCEDISLRLFF